MYLSVNWSVADAHDRGLLSNDFAVLSAVEHVTRQDGFVLTKVGPRPLRMDAVKA